MSLDVACQEAGGGIVLRRGDHWRRRGRAALRKVGKRWRLTEALLNFRKILSVCGWLAALGALAGVNAVADEPKPTPENTIHVQLAAPVPPQKFAKPVKFFISEVVDRSGNPQPLLVLRDRGGVFLDRQPTQITRETLEVSLKAADLLADAASADLVLQIYVFHFGLAHGSGFDFFGKVEFSVMVKNLKTEESQQIEAKGTSIANLAVRKKNIQKNVQADIEGALEDAVRNLLRGTQLKEAVAALLKNSPSAPAAAPSGEMAFLQVNGDNGKSCKSKVEER
jgi:hypothetical protein